MKVIELSPNTHRPGFIHARDRDWIESNCYVDLILEIVHALGLEPRACLAFTLAADFEDDQWTFYKPPHGDLYDCYGLRIEELNIWRPVLEHVVCHTEAGRIPLIEVDAYYLPDTSQTDYRRRHSKTTIAVNSVDPAAERMQYFHNVGYFELADADFRGLFRLDRDTPPDWLAPYCELLKVDGRTRLDDAALAELAWQQVSRYMAMAPRRNPISAYGSQVADQIAWVATQDEATYHDYVFATLRQCGSCYEHTALLLDWLSPDAADAAKAFREISATAKMLVMKTARMAATGRLKDVSPQLDAMARSWEEGMERLTRLTR